jgi:ubiquinone/menaquinone biosynthesis C-methylase UbiE
MITSQSAQSVQAHFDAAAVTYDQVFTDSLVGRAERHAVWQELERAFCPGQRILEINCGTGADALYLAEKGIAVLACDLAPRMIEMACQRASLSNHQGLMNFRVLASEDIDLLRGEGPFDGAFSNFAGLNCVEDISRVARSLGRLVKPGGSVLLCMAGPFVPWEIVWHLAHGNPRGALRRFRVGSKSCSDSRWIKVQYPSVRTLARRFAPEFRLKAWKGIGVLMPPAYCESWARRFPRIFDWMAKGDEWVGRCRGLRGMGGHVLLHFERLRHPIELRKDQSNSSIRG